MEDEFILFKNLYNVLEQVICMFTKETRAVALIFLICIIYPERVQ